jgi:hypothetical protein
VRGALSTIRRKRLGPFLPQLCALVPRLESESRYLRGSDAPAASSRALNPLSTPNMIPKSMPARFAWPLRLDHQCSGSPPGGIYIRRVEITIVLNLDPEVGRGQVLSPNG